VAARAQVQQRTGLEQEAAVVADVVDHRQTLVAVLAQAATELLQPDDLRFGGPKHHHRVDRRYVHALVEHVHGEDDLQVAGGQALQRYRSRIGTRPRVHRGAGDALVPEI